MSESYCYSLDKAFNKAIARAQTLFGSPEDSQLAGLARVGEKLRPTMELS